MERVSARAGVFSLGFLGAGLMAGGGEVIGNTEAVLGWVVLAGGAAAVVVIGWKRLWKIDGWAAGGEGVPGSVVLLVGVLVWLGQHLGMSSAAVLLGAGPETLRGVGLMGLGAAVGAGLGFAAGWFATRGLGAGLIRRWRGDDLVQGVVWSGLCVFVVQAVGILAQLVATVVRGEAPDRLAHKLLVVLDANGGMIGGWWLMAIGYLVLIGPLIEEVIFRGFVQEGMVRVLGGNRWAAIGMTSAAFVVVHVGAVDVQAMVPLFALSVLLGILKERTGGVWAGVMVHGVFNAVNIWITLAG